MVLDGYVISVGPPKESLVDKISINVFHSDELSHMYCYNKYGIDHFVFKGVAGSQNFY